MALKVYTYKNCGTCRRALKWLDEQGVAYTEIPIRERPATKSELNRMLRCQHGNIRKLFNTSGADYKALNLKDKLPELSEKTAIGLLNGNGNLVKRPFVLSGTSGTTGFNESVWRELFV